MLRTRSLRAPLVCLGALALAASALIAGGGPSATLTSDPITPPVTISQIYGGGGNSGAEYRNDFIELYNRTAAPVSVAGWSVQYASSAGSSWNVTPLSGSIAPHSHYLIQQAAGSGGTKDLPAPDATGTTSMAAGAGKVALVSSTAALTGTCPSAAVIVDFVGFGSTASCFEGSGPTPAPSNTLAVLRRDNGAIDTNSNAADFETGAPNPRNGAGAPTGTAAASPASLSRGESTLLTVAVSPGRSPASTGLAVHADLSPIGGSAAQAFYDDGTHGDASGGDSIFSFTATVAASASPGPKTIVATISDAEGRSSETAISVTVAGALSNVRVSQVYGGGGNSGATYRNDFVELFNRSAEPVNVSGWSVQYASSSGTSWQVAPLTGTVRPGRYYLVQLAPGAGGTVDLPSPEAIGNIAMAAGSGKVALVATTTPLTGSCPSTPELVDLVGYGSANCSEGGAAAPALNNTTAAHRVDGGAIDTDNNGADFIAAAPTPRNGTGLPPTGTGHITPGAVDSGDVALVTVAVTAGRFPSGTAITVTADLTDIAGAAAQPLFDDGTNGDAVAGDLTFSFSTVVTGPQGTVRSITATIADEHDRSSETTFTVAIAPDPTPIHVIQGMGTTSTMQGQLVSTTGIVTAVRPSSFYIQRPDDEADGDPATSQGLLIFTGFPRPEGFGIGDLVKVTGTVTEFRQFSDSESVTEITSPFTKVISTGHSLPAAVELLPSYTSPDGGLDQLERFEGMRVTANITAITGTAAFSRSDAEEIAATSVSNGDFFAVITGVPRPMREPGIEQRLPLPPGAPCCVPRFDENPERIRVDSDGQSGASKIEIVAGQTIPALTGVLDYGSRVYTIVADAAAWTPGGRGEALPVPAASATEFTIASFNMERFYDTADEPDTRDVVLTPAAFEVRLAKASATIRDVLRMPDILGVQEVENVDALAAIAARVNADAAVGGRPNPSYVAYLFEGNDIGGIDVGFLVKTARVRVADLRQEGKAATYIQPNGNPALLNDRPPVVLEAEIVEAGAENYPVTVIVNHLRSLSGINGADAARVRAKRLAQADYLATLVQARQAANPQERIVLIGDFNAFQFNDGYVDVLGSIKGQPAPPDRVLLAGEDVVDPDLVNLGDSLAADQYSYLFDGNAQTLDHVLANAAALGRFSRIAYARTNADFPESLRGDAARPERLSDHDPVVAYFRLPGTPAVTLNGAQMMTLEAGSTFTDPGATANDDELGALAVITTGSVDTMTLGSYTLSYSASNGFRTTTITRTVVVADTIAPSVTGMAVTPTDIYVPDHQMIDVAVAYTATDLMGTPVCSLAVSSNEPANTLGDGNTEADWEVVDDRNVRVRAERSGRGSGRTYTVSVTCVDPSGNHTTKSAALRVHK